jgi:hypothetical protein
MLANKTQMLLNETPASKRASWQNGFNAGMIDSRKRVLPG